MFISRKEKHYIEQQINELKERVNMLEHANKIPDYSAFLTSRYVTIKNVIYAILSHLHVDIATEKKEERIVLKKIATQRRVK